MLTEKPAAEAVALEFLKSFCEPEALPIEILRDQTLERPYGWVFFYQSRRYLETGLISDALAGNGPLLVEKSGRIIPLPSGIKVEEALRRHEAGLPLVTPPNKLNKTPASKSD